MATQDPETRNIVVTQSDMAATLFGHYLATYKDSVLPKTFQDPKTRH